MASAWAWFRAAGLGFNRPDFRVRGNDGVEIGDGLVRARRAGVLRGAVLAQGERQRGSAFVQIDSE